MFMICFFLQGRFTMAAKHHITIAEIYETEVIDIDKVRLPLRSSAHAEVALGLLWLVRICQESLSLREITQIRAWIKNFIHFFMRDVITHSCPNVSVGFAKPLYGSSDMDE